MPDSFSLPPWGSQQFNERDLDSLLAGRTDVPQALRPVADTLSALRAAPSARELRDEAAVRARFRAKGRVPAGQAAHTLEMPAVPGAHRSRPRRNARRPARGWFAGLMAAAAVIVLGAAVTYTGHLPGPVQRIAHDTIAAPSPKDVTGGAQGGVQAKSASPEPARTYPATGAVPSSAKPSDTSPPSRDALCDAFWADLEYPRPGPMSWQTPRYRALTAAAGGPRKVFAYCAPVWQHQFAPQYPRLPSYPPYFPKKWSYGEPSGGPDQQHGNDAGGGSGPNPGAPRPGNSPADKAGPQQQGPGG